MLAANVKQVIGVDNSAAMLKAARKILVDFQNVDLRRGELGERAAKKHLQKLGLKFLAANFRSAHVDVFDTNFAPVTLGTGGFGTFTDPNGDHAGFAPFGIADISGQIFVTFAKQNATKHDDLAGSGNGFVDVFDTAGNFVRRVASHGTLNSPWGLVRAPINFGAFSGDLLTNKNLVKRFYREPGRVRLQPENAHMQPIYARDLQLEGVVTAVIRLLN